MPQKKPGVIAVRQSLEHLGEAKHGFLMLAHETPVGSFHKRLRRSVLELTTELEQCFRVLSNEEKIAK